MSGAEEPKKSPIEVAGDDDWKDRVKAEDAKLDEQSKSDSERPADDREGIDPSMIPEPTFATLVQMFSTQALVSLGLVPMPDGKVNRQLHLAKHFIGMLTVLEEKTKRNLTGHEANLLETTLHELRLAYVEVSKADTTGSDTN